MLQINKCVASLALTELTVQHMPHVAHVRLLGAGHLPQSELVRTAIRRSRVHNDRIRLVRLDTVPEVLGHIACDSVSPWSREDDWIKADSPYPSMAFGVRMRTSCLAEPLVETMMRVVVRPV